MLSNENYPNIASFQASELLSFAHTYVRTQVCMYACNVLMYVCMYWTGLDWTGLEWNGMEWNGMECMYVYVL